MTSSKTGLLVGSCGTMLSISIHDNTTPNKHTQPIDYDAIERSYNPKHTQLTHAHRLNSCTHMTFPR